MRFLSWLRQRMVAETRMGRNRKQRPRPSIRPRLEVLEDRLAPATVQLGLASEQLLESAGTFTIPVTISSASAVPTSVPFTLAGDAVSGTDYSGVTSSPVVIPAGQTAVNITGTLLDDGAPDATKTLTLTLGSPSGGATLGATTVNTLTIAEPAANPTTLSIANSSAIEPAANGTVNMNFTVTRTGNFTSQLTVGYTTVPGTAQPTTDFTPTTGTTTFASGSATATISIPIFGNGVADNASLAFSVQLTGVVSVIGPPVTFGNESFFPAGSLQVYVAVGDLNGDGKPDIVALNTNDSTVSVLLNTTTPGSPSAFFGPQKVFATGTSVNPHPVGVALADVNGDGKLDLVVSNFNDDTVSVLLNTTPPGATTASFAAQQIFAVGLSPNSVAVADVNGDGKPDIIVPNTFDNTVSVLLNTTPPGSPTVTFAIRQTFAAGNGPSFVAVGDVNGDGKPDLVVTNGEGVSVLLNTTPPGAAMAFFAPQQTFATGVGPREVRVGDLNGDGKPDLVVGNILDNTVSVLLNTTTPGSSMASFAPQQTFATGTDPLSVALGDLNGDGEPDIVVTNLMDSTVSVLRNTTPPGASTASFAPQQTFAAGGDPFMVALGDFNGDGEPDLLLANSINMVSVLLNRTVLGETTITPAFPQAGPAAAVSTGPVSIAVGDINGDGKPDLVVANGDQFADTVSVLLNTTPTGAATPTFAAQQTFATGLNPQSVVLGDVNGDGKLDILVANLDNTVSVLLNTTPPGASTPTFADQQTFPTGRTPQYATLADVNGDGQLDIIAANTSPDGTVSVLLNTTTPGSFTASFAPRQSIATGAPLFVAVGDLNGDGKPDIVAPNTNANTVTVLLNTTPTGAPILSFTQQTFATDSPTAVALGDVNGDGKLDIVVANVSSNTVSVFLNMTPAGALLATFAAQQTFAAGAFALSVALADVNDDGKPDIVVANTNDSTVSVLRNTTPPGASTASFATQQTFATGARPRALAVGDVNGDGQPDVLVANFNDNTVTVLLNTPVRILGNLATGTILENNGPQPTVQFGAASESVSESAGTFSIPVTLSAVSAAAVSVPFTLGGTAVTGTDYNGVTASPLIIAAGQLSGTITGAIVDDGLYGGSTNETLIATLGAPAGAIIGSPATNTLTINEIMTRPSFPGLTAQERFVQALYLDELGRAGSVAELDSWVALLNGPGGAAAVVAYIKGSLEGTDHLVKTWYQLFLGRPAQAGEELGWASALQIGQTEEMVLSYILSSPEFYSRAQMLVAAGSPAERYVLALYQLLLHRTASPAEVASWVNLGRQQVAAGFLRSQEFRTALIQGYYDGLLHRSGAPYEVNGWVLSVQDASRVRATFETSAEFFNNG
jgi:hypothetical protein